MEYKRLGHSGLQVSRICTSWATKSNAVVCLLKGLKGRNVGAPAKGFCKSATLSKLYATNDSTWRNEEHGDQKKWLTTFGQRPG
jgi:hypothetical protein